MFVRLGTGPKGSHCFGMEGLIAEGKDLLGDAAELTVKDAALTSAGRRLGSYMTARFGCASILARRLGQGKASVLLQEMENESEAMDANLVALADTIIQQTADVGGALS
jgi:ferritin-like metal-binding protein YciE